MVDALPPHTPPVVAVCIQLASERYQLPKLALYSIAAAEAGYPGLSKKNRNGTLDLGRMQINTSNLPELSKHGITAEMLRTDECANIQTGAWKLAKYLRKEEGDWYRAIARYNVGSLNTPGRQAAGHRYAAKVIGYWNALFYAAAGR